MLTKTLNDSGVDKGRGLDPTNLGDSLERYSKVFIQKVFDTLVLTDEGGDWKPGLMGASEKLLADLQGLYLEKNGYVTRADIEEVFQDSGYGILATTTTISSPVAPRTGPNRQFKDGQRKLMLELRQQGQSVFVFSPVNGSFRTAFAPEGEHTLTKSYRADSTISIAQPM